MPEQIRFLLDEHVPGAIAAALKQKGIEATTLHEVGRRGLSDLEQAQFAHKEEWVFVTFDSDYLCWLGKKYSIQE